MKSLLLVACALVASASCALADFEYIETKDALDGTVSKRVLAASDEGFVTFSLIYGDLLVAVTPHENSVICSDLNSRVRVEWSPYNGDTRMPKTLESWHVSQSRKSVFQSDPFVYAISDAFKANEGIRFRVSDECGKITTMTVRSKGFGEAISNIEPKGE